LLCHHEKRGEVAIFLDDSFIALGALEDEAKIRKVRIAGIEYS
jgi:hypothetical protein